MADRPRYPDSGDDAGEPDSGTTAGISLWMKVLIVVFGALVVIALVLHLVLGGGPRH